MTRDGRIDINLYHGAVSRCKALEKRLDEKEAILIEFVEKYYAMKERAGEICRKYAWTAARDTELKKLREEFLQETVYNRGFHTYKTNKDEVGEIECISGTWYISYKDGKGNDSALAGSYDSFAEAERMLFKHRPKAKKIA